MRNHLNLYSVLTNVVLPAGITDKVVLERDMTRKNDDFENARSTNGNQKSISATILEASNKKKIIFFK